MTENTPATAHDPEKVRAAAIERLTQKGYVVADQTVVTDPKTGRKAEFIVRGDSSKLANVDFDDVVNAFVVAIDAELKS